jgi:hypothetical protein
MDRKACISCVHILFIQCKKTHIILKRQTLSDACGECFKISDQKKINCNVTSMNSVSRFIYSTLYLESTDVLTKTGAVKAKTETREQSECYRNKNGDSQPGRSSAQ